ncbi:MAG: hypothetical protein WD068_02595 [Candidatus Babeliales bacterium]
MKKIVCLLTLFISNACFACHKVVWYDVVWNDADLLANLTSNTNFISYHNNSPAAVPSNSPQKPSAKKHTLDEIAEILVNPTKSTGPSKSPSPIIVALQNLMNGHKKQKSLS